MVAGERVSHIVVTHSHRDHVAGAAALRAKTGAPIFGARAHVPRPRRAARLDASHALDYAPDAALADGERIVARGFTLEAIATPGHAANHLCFALLEENALFSGDYVMAWSTSVVAPPDGSMADYMASLESCAARRGDLLARPRRPGRATRNAGSALCAPPPPARGGDPRRLQAGEADIDASSPASTPG